MEDWENGCSISEDTTAVPRELQLNSDPEDEEEDEEEEADEEEDNNTINNKNIEDEAEEDEEEEEEDEGYRFRFQDEMDPSDFTQDNPFGVEPYQQFERLENQYEALAAKKRKALNTPNRDTPAKKPRHEDVFEELVENMNYGRRRKSRKSKKKGRRKGSRRNVTPEVSKKLGNATLLYALGSYQEAIPILNEVIRVSPNIPDAYHTLGLIYNAMGYKERAIDFYMLAAHLSPKDASLWKLLVTWSIEQGNRGQARYCLSKAITADPEDTSLKFHRASLYIELGDFQKAAESYEQISRLKPHDIQVLITATKLYKRCGQHERAINMIENHLKDHPSKPDLTVVNLLVSLNIEDHSYLKALEHIEHAQQIYCAGKELPLYLTIKAGICHAHLGHIEKAEAIFSILQPGKQPDYLIVEVANSLMSLELYESAYKYYMMLDKDTLQNNGKLNLEIAQCCLSVGERVQAIEYFYKAIEKLEDSVEARLTLSSLLIEDGNEDKAFSILSPPTQSDSSSKENSDNKSKPWWVNGKIKLKLCQIYKAKGLIENFVNVISPVIIKTLSIENDQQGATVRRRLTNTELNQRMKVLNENKTDNVFQNFRPVAPAKVLADASRAKRKVRKREQQKEEKRAAALAAGEDWISDFSDNESLPVLREPPLPNLLKDDELHLLMIDVCKALFSLQNYFDSSIIINRTLKLASNTMSNERLLEFRKLSVQVGYKSNDPVEGFNCARFVVNQHPYSFSVWNYYYKIVSRFRSDTRISSNNKFLLAKRNKYKDCVPPMVISGHQFTIISQHQTAARDYLEAYKLMPDNPLINLCAGTALINLALGFRLQNKHQCIMQGLTFLYNNLRLSKNHSQEALYNIGRAYHHVGMVSLATKCYEMVLAIHEKDFPIPKLPVEDQDVMEDLKAGYCDVRREAAYNLHLIYKNSGAFDLARQVLKDYCVI